QTQIDRRDKPIDGIWLNDSLESTSDILIAGVLPSGSSTCTKQSKPTAAWSAPERHRCHARIDECFTGAIEPRVPALDIPLGARIPGTGGMAAPSRECRKRPKLAQTGWSAPENFSGLFSQRFASSLST